MIGCSHHIFIYRLQWRWHRSSVECYRNVNRPVHVQQILKMGALRIESRKSDLQMDNKQAASSPIEERCHKRRGK